MKTFLFAAAVIGFILGSSASAYYKVIDLGNLGGTSSYAYSINDNGQIVGWAANSSGYERACLFDSTGHGANVDLGTFGGTRSEAYSINNNGQIVGFATIIISPGYLLDRACLFDPTGHGANKDLSTLGSEDSYAWSINNTGQIVGHSLTGNRWRACLFDPTGGGANKDLGSRYLYALSINDSGQIVGTAANGHAYLFDSKVGSNIDLGTLANYSSSTANSINNIGQIVGVSQNIGGGPPGIACLFDSTGGGANVNLGALGGDFSGACSINDNSQIVGWADGRACLFDSTGQGNNIDLNTLIDPSSGWTLKYAYSINNNVWIVGQGINPAGYEHAYLLIPEPASALIMGLGGLLLTLRRRHC
jgi:probable HAF family extracellular repeat protein